MKNFAWPVRVYYEDTDAGGVVFYANYLKYFERARTEWLRAMGYEQDMLRREAGILFVVKSVRVDYLKPALFNEELLVSARILDVKPASLVFEQTVMRPAQDHEILSRGNVRIACLDAASRKPKLIPEHLLTKIKDDL